MHATLTFWKTWKLPGAYLVKFSRIPMQPPQLQLKLKTFPILHHGNHLLCFHAQVSQVSNPSRSCREVLQAPSKNAGYFFIKHGKFRDHAWEHFVGLLPVFII